MNAFTNNNMIPHRMSMSFESDLNSYPNSFIHSINFFICAWSIQDPKDPKIKDVPLDFNNSQLIDRVRKKVSIALWCDKCYDKCVCRCVALTHRLSEVIHWAQTQRAKKIRRTRWGGVGGGVEVRCVWQFQPDRIMRADIQRCVSIACSGS